MLLEVVVLQPMCLEAGLGVITGLVLGLLEVGVLIHIMVILPRKGVKIMTVRILFQAEAPLQAEVGATTDFKEAEVRCTVITRVPDKRVIDARNQDILPTRVGRRPPCLASNLLLINPAEKLTRFLRQSQMTS